VTHQFQFRLGVAAIAISFATQPRETSAQSIGQQAAWNGLTLSPAGGLAPLARVPADLTAGSSDISLRYGRWRYDPDDAVHDSFGLTWARRLAFAGVRIEITGAYALVECPTCSSSLMGGIDLESTLARHGAADATGNQVRASVDLRLSLGGARSLGTDRTVAGSTALSLPMNLALPLGSGSSFAISIQPGFGYGHIASPDFGAGGILPMFGTAISLHTGRRFGVHIGAERVFVDGGPTQVGAGLSWWIR
jgi:hypothetical protein